MYSASNYINIIVLCLYFFESKSFKLNDITRRRIRETGNQGCLLPDHPRNGLWTIYKATKNFYPSEIAPFGSVLQVNCRENFKIDGDPFVVCIDGRWTAQLGECIRTCSSLHSTAVMKVTCRYNDRVLEKCTEPLHGTLAHFLCADFYEDHSLELHPIHVCSNGRWSHSLPECLPICGRKIIEGTTLIINGSEAKQGDYPWQVALYNVSNQELLCGGTLINQKVIVTAAHCITNNDGKMQPKEMYSVAVGKYYRQYSDLRDLNDAQFSVISEMFIPRQYRGEIQNYFGDIAILITKDIFELSRRVQPICIDWGLNRQSILDPRRITHGFVSGWGFTIEHKNPSNVLKQLQVPIISDEECVKRLPENYEKFLTDDKLCAGFSEKGTSVCKGDSGGGLVTPIQQGPTAKRYYLVGIVSLSPQAPTAEGGCDSQNYALYTRVPYYVQNFILQAEVRYRPIYTEDSLELITSTTRKKPLSSTVTSTTTKTITSTTTEKTKTETCVIPKSALQENLIISDTHLSPNAPISDGKNVTLTCKKGYYSYIEEKLINENHEHLSQCKNGQWSPPIPKCLKKCDPLKSSLTIKLSCFNNNTALWDCQNPKEETTAKYKCPPFHHDFVFGKIPSVSNDALKPYSTCHKGSWSSQNKYCLPNCGKKLDESAVSNPWQASIYLPEKKFVCHGALISEKIVITDHSCLTNEAAQSIYARRLITVSVGKTSNPQEHKVDTIKVARTIGIVTVKTSFIRTISTYPVCLDYHKEFIHNNLNLTGIILDYKDASFVFPLNSTGTNKIKAVEMKIKPDEECSQQNPIYNPQDTFCATYTNGMLSKCSLTLGTPLVVKNEETGSYYLAGISSSFNNFSVCNNTKYVFFTKVWNYVDENIYSLRS